MILSYLVSIKQFNNRWSPLLIKSRKAKETTKKNKK